MVNLALDDVRRAKVNRMLGVASAFLVVARAAREDEPNSEAIVEWVERTFEASDGFRDFMERATFRALDELGIDLLHWKRRVVPGGFKSPEIDES